MTATVYVNVLFSFVLSEVQVFEIFSNTRRMWVKATAERANKAYFSPRLLKKGLLKESAYFHPK